MTLKALIVDDEARNCRLLEVFINAEGYQALLANSGTRR